MFHHAVKSICFISSKHIFLIKDKARVKASVFQVEGGSSCLIWWLTCWWTMMSHLGHEELMIVVVVVTADVCMWVWIKVKMNTRKQSLFALWEDADLVVVNLSLTFTCFHVSTSSNHLWSVSLLLTHSVVLPTKMDLHTCLIHLVTNHMWTSHLVTSLSRSNYSLMCD